MLKKFENLGTALSRNESKKVVGGNYTVLVVDLGEASGCSHGGPCGPGDAYSCSVESDGTCCCGHDRYNSDCTTYGF